jgi:hypothetical protein
VRLGRDLKHQLDGVRPLAVHAGNEVELEGRDAGAGGAVDDLERVQEDPEEPRNDVEVDNVQRRLGPMLKFKHVSGKKLAKFALKCCCVVPIIDHNTDFQDETGQSRCDQCS